jgi:hypothetical protein
MLVNYLLCIVTKSWCKLPEDGDKVETCSS